MHVWSEFPFLNLKGTGTVSLVFLLKDVSKRVMMIIKRFAPGWPALFMLRDKFNALLFFVNSTTVCWWNQLSYICVSFQQLFQVRYVPYLNNWGTWLVRHILNVPQLISWFFFQNVSSWKKIHLYLHTHTPTHAHTNHCQKKQKTKTRTWNN